MTVALIVIAVIGVVASGLYGWKAFDAFEIDTGTKSKWLLRHQRWFNFCGSAVGWLAVVLIVYKVGRCWNVQCPADVSAGDVLLGVVAFVGITGHLPYALQWVVSNAQQ